MKATGLLLLLAIAVIQTQARSSRWRRNRSSREVKDSSESMEMHDWLTAEQKSELEPLKHKPAEFRDKVMVYYKQLPQEKQDKWNKVYKKECVEWIKEVASEAEIEELKQLKAKKDKKTLESKVLEYRARLPEQKRKMVEVWEENCRELWKDELSRKRRDIDKNFEDFTKWMTAEQKKEVSDMKDAGKSFEELREKTVKYFEALPAEKQQSLKEEFKGKCKEFFKKISKPEELEKMKALHEAGNDAEVRTVLKGVIGRLSGDEQKLAGKMEMLCTDVYAVKTKKRRDIDEKINKRLSWMTADQKEEIKQMYASGKSQADIRAKIFEYLSALEGPAGIAAKEKTQKECYKWMEDVASAEEIAALHKMHETDHAGCKKKVREFMGRLSADRRDEVEKNLPFCEKVWYGEHDHHGHHGHHHRRHLAVRRRRHLHAIDKFLDWLTPEQKTKLEDIEKSGSHFDEVIAKVKEFYSALPEAKQAELKANFKSQCSAWVKEVATTEEMDSIRKMHEAKNHAELKKKLLELENRLTEEQKHTVEHVREVCLGVWEMQNSRRRRDHHEHHIDEDMKKYLTWLTADQKAKVKEHFDKGDKETGYKMVMEMFESATGDAKAKAIDELKAACKHYGRDILGDKNADIIKDMKDAGATNEAISKKVEEMIGEITEDDKKTKAHHLVAGCKKIYGAARFRRDHHHEHNVDEAMEKYLTWLTADQKDKVKEKFTKGDREDAYKMIMEMFEASSGDVKAKASEELKAACKHYGRDLLGDKNADAIKEMHESGATHEAIYKRVDEMIAEIADEDKRKKAERLVAGCKKISKAARVRREHHHEHNIDEAMEKYLTWMTADQKDKVKEKFTKGDREDAYKMIMEMFEASSGDIKAKASEELKAACKHYGRDLLGDKNADAIKEMHESGATHEAISKRVDEMIAEIADEDKRKKAERLTAGCKKIYGAARFRRRRDHHHEHNIDEAMEKYLTWLTADQKDKVKEKFSKGDREDAYKMIMEMFEASSGDVKAKASEELKAACKHYGRDLLGDKNADAIKEMHESGATHEAISKRVDEMISEIADEDKRKKAERLTAGCKKIYGAARVRRDHHHHHTLDEAFEKYLTWLNEDQKTELKSLKEGGDKEGIYKKIMEFFDATSGDTKEKAAEELQAACKHYIKDFVGEDKAAEFKKMKESGVPVDEIAKKVEEAIEEIGDDAVKSKAKKASIACKRVFGVSRRFRREHHEHTFEEAMEKYLTWLTADQKIELKSLYDAGDKGAMYDKVMEMFDAATGETKEKAVKELKGACKHYVKDLIGDANAEEIREMKDSGASNDAIATKVEEMIEKIADDKKKAQALRASTYCKKIYGTARRMRRDHDHEHNLEEAMEKYLAWLNADQKAEVKKLFEAEGRPAVYKKVLEYFEAASGEVKEQATTELQAACKHYVKDHIGAENAEKLKEMKDSGAAKEAIAAKLDEFIAAITDDKKKEQATRASAACKKIFGVNARRMRRDHHEHNLEEAMEKYLTWLTDDQKAEVKKFFESGDRAELYSKVMEYFEASSGEVKEKAAFELKAACKHYIKDYIGEENAAKIKEMKDSGVSHEAIAAKVDEFINAISDEKKKEKALRAAKGCKKVYGVAKRMKRDHHDHAHSLKEAMEKYLSWMTPEQQAEIKRIFEEEGRPAVYKKVMEEFDSASGEVKEKAAEELKAACKHYVKDYIGAENAEKIKEMKDSGASKEAIAKKVDEFIAAISDEKKKETAMKASADCKKIYGVARRMRREHHHEHNLEEAMKNYLTWLNDDQKEEVKKVLKGGDRLAAYKKVMEFYEATSGDKKAKAATELKAACKHYIKDLIGEEKAARIRHMKESGATNEAIAQEVDAIISLIPNEEKRMQAKHAAADCKKIYGIARRMRRDHHEHTLEEAFEKYLTWLDDSQKNELKQMKEKGDREAIYKKVMEYFDGASGDVKAKATEELQSGCKHYIMSYVGKEKADELKALKDSGASKEEMAKKVDEAIEAIADEETKTKAKKAAMSCRKIYGVTKARRHLAARRRRHHPDNVFHWF
ncbi:hypothetical protein Aduo_016752 [Ancylostoma duodenale]